jgi:cyclohexyl-isocyanide hydratase
VFSGLADLAKVDTCDVLCVPGGDGVRDAIVDDAFMREVRRLAGTARYLTSVCTGALILGALGLLRGKRATTYWALRDSLARFGAIVDVGRVARDGNVITGGGVTAGIDLALVAVAEIFGRTTAEAIQLRLEYAPAPPFQAGNPEQATPELIARVQKEIGADLEADRAAVERAARRLEHA